MNRSALAGIACLLLAAASSASASFTVVLGGPNTGYRFDHAKDYFVDNLHGHVKIEDFSGYRKQTFSIDGYPDPTTDFGDFTVTHHGSLSISKTHYGEDAPALRAGNSIVSPITFKFDHAINDFGVTLIDPFNNSSIHRDKQHHAQLLLYGVDGYIGTVSSTRGWWHDEFKDGKKLFFGALGLHDLGVTEIEFFHGVKDTNGKWWKPEHDATGDALYFDDIIYSKKKDTITTNPIPEPSVIVAAISLGLIGLTVVRRRFRRS